MSVTVTPVDGEPATYERGSTFYVHENGTLMVTENRNNHLAAWGAGTWRTAIDNHPLPLPPERNSNP